MVNTNIEDSRSWLPLHIAIKKASEENCTEEEREERIEIVRKLALISDVEFLMSEDTVQTDNGNVVLTFSTSLGELKVVLKQRKDSIEIKVCDQKMFDQLVNSQEELGKNCRLGGLPVSEAINRGFFIRSSKPFSSYENTTPFNEVKNIHKKEGWCERISNEVKYSRERGI